MQLNAEENTVTVRATMELKGEITTMISRKKLIEIDFLLEDMLGWVKPADIPAAKKHKEKIFSYLEKLSDKPCPECKSTNGYHPAECSRAMVL